MNMLKEQAAFIRATLPNAAATYAVLDEVAAERARQETLVAHDQIPFTCADRDVDILEKYPVLGEEFGEVGEALQILQRAKWDMPYAVPAAQAHLRDELLQVAAVAVAMAESLTDHQQQTEI